MPDLSNVGPRTSRPRVVVVGTVVGDLTGGRDVRGPINTKPGDAELVADRVADDRAKVEGKLAKERAECVLKFLGRKPQVVSAVIITGGLFVSGGGLAEGVDG